MGAVKDAVPHLPRPWKLTLRLQDSHCVRLSGLVNRAGSEEKVWQWVLLSGQRAGIQGCVLG